MNKLEQLIRESLVTETKIPQSEYQNIVDMKKSGMGLVDIGKKYDVTPSSVSLILKKKLGDDSRKYYKKIKIPQSEYQNIVDMRNSGMKLEDIAKEYNGVGESTIRRILKKVGFDTDISKPKITINQKVVNMYRQGKSPKEISLELNINIKHIIKILEKMGVAQREVQYKR